MKQLRILVNADNLRKDDNEYDDMFIKNLEMYNYIFEEEDKLKRCEKLATLTVKSNVYAREVATCHELIERIMRNPIGRVLVLKTLKEMSY